MALRVGLTNITTSNEWEKFFLEELKCSPDKAQAYSHDFVSQDITSSNIVYGLADPTFLNQFNLSIGHQLEIRSIFTPKPIKLEPATNSRAPSNKPHIRHQPPQLKPSMTPSSFRGFVSHWTTYKGLVGLPWRLSKHLLLGMCWPPTNQTNHSGPQSWTFSSVRERISRDDS